MRILLTRPWNHTSMLIPNHGLGYLATALKQSGHDPVILDCILQRMDPDAFNRLVRSSSFDAIGFQLYTFDLPQFNSYLSLIRDLTIPLIAGGPHPSAVPLDFMNDYTRIDYAFRGEAEIGLPMLLDVLASPALASTAILESIPGLCFRHERRVQSNPPVFHQTLDDFGMPDWEQISPLTYPVAPQGTFTRALPVAPITITRGCPYPCTFCAGKQVSGRRIRTRSVSHVIHELRFLVEHFGIREFHIQDDNFTFDKQYVLAFCRALIDSRLNLVWACPNGIRLDSLDRDMLDAMSAAGCYSVAVGIESGSQRILNLMKKRTSLPDLIDRVNLIRKATNWRITGFFILGYPGETREEMEATIRLSRRLPLDKANFGILMPLPATEATQAAIEMGWNASMDYDRMSEYRSTFYPEGMTARDFRMLFRRAFIGFYCRPRIMAGFLREIKSRDQFKVLIRRFLDVVRS